MGAERTTKAVVDASGLIAFLNREDDRYDKSRELLLDAEENRIELWAPMVIQVEVSRWSRDVDPADADARAMLEAFLESEWLRLVEVDRRMAKIARDVVATTTVKTGVDALYVATAVIVEAHVVNTWDDLQGQVACEGINGSEPPGAVSPRLDLDSS